MKKIKLNLEKYMILSYISVTLAFGTWVIVNAIAKRKENSGLLSAYKMHT